MFQFKAGNSEKEENFDVLFKIYSKKKLATAFKIYHLSVRTTRLLVNNGKFSLPGLFLFLRLTLLISWKKIRKKKIRRDRSINVEEFLYKFSDFLKQWEN